MIEEKKLDVFKLKLIAFTGCAMLNAAWGGLIPSSLLWLKMILGFLGATSIPIFSLLLSEGIKHTRSLTKYMLRLICLALVCGYPYYMLYHDPSGSNFLFREYLSGPFAVFYTAGILVIYDRLPYKWLKNTSIVLFIALSLFLGVEYAPVSLIIAYIIHIYRSEEQIKFRNFNIVLFSAALALAAAALYFLNRGNSSTYYNVDLIQLVTLSGAALAVPVINMYNGKNNIFSGRAAVFFAKYIFYFAYFALIAGLAFIKFLLVSDF